MLSLHKISLLFNDNEADNWSTWWAASTPRVTPIDTKQREWKQHNNLESMNSMLNYEDLREEMPMHRVGVMVPHLGDTRAARAPPRCGMRGFCESCEISC